MSFLNELKGHDAKLHNVDSHGSVKYEVRELSTQEPILKQTEEQSSR